MDFKLAVIRLISVFVSKAPFFFTKRMVFLANCFLSEQNGSKNYSDSFDVIKTYSFLDPRLKWKLKGVSSVSNLSAEQVNRLHEWKAKTNLYRFRSKDKTSINDNSIFNIGLFSTSPGYEGNPDVISLGVHSEFVSGCSVSLVSCSNGVYYLSVYWNLGGKATQLVKDVDVSNVDDRKVNYFTCNPFSELYGCSSTTNKLRQAQEMISHGFEIIDKEISLLERRLMNTICIGSAAKPARNMDIFINESEPYFYDEEEVNKIQAEKSPYEFNSDYRPDELLIGRSPLSSMFTVYQDKNKKEFFLHTIPQIEAFPFKGVFIKSEKMTQDEASKVFHATYENRPCHVAGSHNTFAIYQLAKMEFERISDSYSDSILGGHVEASKHYDLLYKAFIEIDALEQKLKTSISWLPFTGYYGLSSGYKESVNNYCCGLSERIKIVKSDIVRRKNNVNELVQSENLKYQKNNSILVVVLALIQVAVAFIAWKWS